MSDNATAAFQFYNLLISSNPNLNAAIFFYDKKDDLILSCMSNSAMDMWGVVKENQNQFMAEAFGKHPLDSFFTDQNIDSLFRNNNSNTFKLTLELTDFGDSGTINQQHFLVNCLDFGVALTACNQNFQLPSLKKIPQALSGIATWLSQMDESAKKIAVSLTSLLTLAGGYLTAINVDYNIFGNKQDQTLQILTKGLEEYPYSSPDSLVAWTYEGRWRYYFAAASRNFKEQVFKNIDKQSTTEYGWKEMRIAHTKNECFSFQLTDYPAKTSVGHIMREHRLSTLIACPFFIGNNPMTKKPQGYISVGFFFEVPNDEMEAHFDYLKSLSLKVGPLFD